MGTYDHMRVGDRFDTPGRTLTAAANDLLVALCGYSHPLFVDRTHLEATPFATPPLPGGLVLALLGALVEQAGVMDGTVQAMTRVDAFELLAPLLTGDTVTLTAEVVGKHPSASGRRGTLTFAWTARNQRGETVATCRPSFLFRTEGSADAHAASVVEKVTPS